VQLLADPVYYGAGVPRGDGRLVVVLPGLFGNDWYLQPLRAWLGRIGYQAVPSTLVVNAGCPERLTREIESNLSRRRQARPGRIALIGHSRGGILARAIASRLGDDVSHLVLLGSPVGGITRWSGAVGWNTGAHSGVAAASTRARRLLDPECSVPSCGCPFPQDLTAPLAGSTSVISIFSREDPIVPAWSCDIPGAQNIAVSGTHIGLASNRTVYRELAAALQE
jgi:pimeloyl-ACP methyl ester carboxylesterase